MTDYEKYWMIKDQRTHETVRTMMAEMTGVDQYMVACSWKGRSMKVGFNDLASTEEFMDLVTELGYTDVYMINH